MTSIASSPTQTSQRRSWAPLVIVCLGNFMLLLDVSVVNVALPRMSIDLHASLSTLEWVVDAYALALAALLMLVGSVSDVVGRKRTYLTGLVVFTVASLTCGIAPSQTVLIAARAIQGAGAVGMFATTIALINNTYDGFQRATAFGIWGATSGVAGAAGPIIGGLLTQALSWRWVFFVNLPVGVITVLAALRALDHDGDGRQRSIDWLGGLAFTASAATLTYALVRADSIGWTATETVVLLALAAAALAAFVVIELRSRAPLLDLSLLHAPFVGTLIAAALYTPTAFAMLVYASLWLQTVLGLTPIAAGLVTLPMMMFGFVVSAAGGKHLDAAPARLVIAAGLALTAAGDLLEIGLGARSHWSDLIAGFVVIGVGIGALAPIIASAATAAVPAERAGMAAGAVNTARQVGLAIGIAVYGSVFTTRVLDGFHRLSHSASIAHRVTSGGAASVLAQTPSTHRPALEAMIRSAVGSGLGHTFLIAGIVGLAGAALSLTIMSRPAAHSLAPERPLTLHGQPQSSKP
ncbi:MAG TPA: MFS transporter [Solirubrobacteraceae bacterium]|nr:MFS transporter [Solirubrobacteraceae bacterium]